jgi:hypothetical protein
MYTRKINVKITNYVKTKPFICNLIDKYIKLKSFQKYEYVKDGNVIAVSNYKIKNLNYDFVIFEDNNGFTTNNIILNDISDNNLNYEESKWSFINISIKFNNDYEIPILLKSFNYNFLITNNKINQKFMKYFLKKYYNNYFTENNTDYSIQLIDSNAEIINFNYLKTLVIYKDNYLLENNTEINNITEINNN